MTLSPKTLTTIVAAGAIGAFAMLPAAFAVHPGAEPGHAASPGDLEWMEGPAMLPPGWQMAVLEGDPAGEGPVVVRLRFPSDYEVPPHTHPSFEHLTVLSGSIHIGFGEEMDKSAGTKLSEGGFIAVPAEEPHFAWTTEETVFQLNGLAPFGTTYVDPSDDPRQTN